MNMEQYLDKLIGLLSPAEWKAWLLMIIVISALVENAKRVFMLRMTPTRKKQMIYTFSFLLGCVGAFVAFYFTGTKQVSNIMWIMIGVTSGPISNFMHWITLGLVAWKYPALADVLKGKKPK